MSDHGDTGTGDTVVGGDGGAEQSEEQSERPKGRKPSKKKADQQEPTFDTSAFLQEGYKMLGNDVLKLDTTLEHGQVCFLSFAMSFYNKTPFIFCFMINFRANAGI